MLASSAPGPRRVDEGSTGGARRPTPALMYYQFLVAYYLWSIEQDVTAVNGMSSGHPGAAPLEPDCCPGAPTGRWAPRDNGPAPGRLRPPHGQVMLCTGTRFRRRVPATIRPV